MAADTIRRLFFTPSIAIARLGASSTPMVAFEWSPGDPRTIGETRIRPIRSLDVDANGNVTVFEPREIRVRDGALIRPVAPFLELWALVGDGPPAQLTPAAVTPELLASNGITESNVTFTVTAMNLKAARRTGDPQLRYGTFPPLTLAGNDHRAVPLRGQSPPDAAETMIPAGRNIPLGRIQILRPQRQPAADVVPPEVRLDVLRLRYTPAAGLFYGPPPAATSVPVDGPAVPQERAFLNPDAGWMNATFNQTAIVNPGDTYDMFDTNPDAGGVSLGVVDDTCELAIIASATIGGAALRARANVMVGPPHFAPDRRPFLSLADEINDRQLDPARDTALSREERDQWVEDLFERVYETASLLDVDFHRSQRAAPVAAPRPEILPPGDGVPAPTRAMGGRDPLRDPDIRIAPREPGQLFPLSERARERHRTLSDISQLKSWVLQHPDRLAALIRPPFSVSAGEDADRSSMQMPPFMRNSNALPLTLADWQYRLLMAWKDALLAGLLVAAGPAAGEPPISAMAAERRRQVLEVLAQQDR